MGMGLSLLMVQAQVVKNIRQCQGSHRPSKTHENPRIAKPSLEGTLKLSNGMCGFFRVSGQCPIMCMYMKRM